MPAQAFAQEGVDGRGRRMLRRSIHRCVGHDGASMRTGGFVEQGQEGLGVPGLRRPTSRIFNEIGTKFADGVGMFRWHAESLRGLAMRCSIMPARTMTM